MRGSVSPSGRGGSGPDGLTGSGIGSHTFGLVPSWDLSNAQVGLTKENGLEVRLIAKNIWDQKASNALYNDSSGELFRDPRFDKLRNSRSRHHRTVGHEAIRLDFANREYIGQHGA